MIPPSREFNPETRRGMGLQGLRITIASLGEIGRGLVGYILHHSCIWWQLRHSFVHIYVHNLQ